MISLASADESSLPRRARRASIRGRLISTVIGFGTLAVVTCVLAPLVGSTSISLTRALDPSIPFDQNVDAQIFFVARLPRVLAGALVGSALAAAGVVFVVVIELAARELTFGALMINLLLLSLPGGPIRRLFPAFLAGYAYLILAAYAGHLPRGAVPMFWYPPA